ncbi:MAG: hypothetical protein R3C05_28430 [Pirellulaceae bacterium]
MAKCDLTIELDQPDRLYQPGDRVCGTVIVQANDDINCKGLRVSSGWATHGRGNIDSGEVSGEIVFQGKWQTGNEYRYAFDLPAGDWPPTYHGVYLSIDRYIKAVADLPWAFDASVSRPFRLSCLAVPSGGANKVVPQSGMIGKMIGVIFVVVFGLVMLLNPFLWLIGFVVAIGASVWWFATRYLPRKRLGSVQYKLQRQQWMPGEKLRATLTVHPRKDIAINGIIWTVTGQETCVSGSGSNRRTHRHEFFSDGQVDHNLTRLLGNRETVIDLSLRLPRTEAFTMDLGDNNIQWTTQVRIDIPRWPDWKDKQDFDVIPSPEPVDGGSTTQPSPAAIPNDDAGTEVGEGPAVTFASTIEMIDSLQGDRHQIDRVVEAVRDLPMQLAIIPERRELASATNPLAYPTGHVVVGHTVEPRMPVVMYIPRSLADEFEQATDRQWEGAGSIVGYEHHAGRLQLRIEEYRV